MHVLLKRKVLIASVELWSRRTSNPRGQSDAHGREYWITSERRRHSTLGAVGILQPKSKWWNRTHRTCSRCNCCHGTLPIRGSWITHYLQSNNAKRMVPRSPCIKALSRRSSWIPWRPWVSESNVRLFRPQYNCPQMKPSSKIHTAILLRSVALIAFSEVYALTRATLGGTSTFVTRTR